MPIFTYSMKWVSLISVIVSVYNFFLLQIIKDPDCGSPQDKMRIFLIMYLCAANMTDAEFNEYATALVEADANTKALLYLKRWKSLMKVV